MRSNTKIVLYVLVFSFGGLWVLQDSGVFESMGFNSGRYVGKVNGEGIDGELYSNQVQAQVEGYRRQGMEVTPALQARIEDQIFEALVDNLLREAELERLGVSVSDSEVQEAFRGTNPAPIILQMFGDGNGNLDRAQLEAFIEDPTQFGQTEQFLIDLEENVRQLRRQAKLDALIDATARVTEAEVDEEFQRRNRRATTDYVAIRYAEIPDDQVEFSDSDLRDYYNDNRDDFARPTTYQFEYVQFEKTPTPEDSARAIEDLEEFREAFTTAEDPGQYAATTAYGIEPIAYVTPSDIGPSLATELYSDLTVGRVVGPIIDGDEAVMARITGVRAADNPVVHARHILVPATQLEMINNLKGQIQRGEVSFEEAARQHSTDESNSSNGGDLGWFGAGQMVAPFEEAAFAASAGQIVGPVETRFGQHLIKVEARASQEVEIVRLTAQVLGSFDQLIQQADDLRYYAEEEGVPFGEEAARRGLVVQTANLLDDQPSIPALQVGRDALAWVRRSNEGEISDAFDATTSYVLMHMTEVTEEGFRPFDEVRAEIEPRVLLAKKREIQLERLREAVAANDDLNAIASAMSSNVQTVDGVALNSPAVAGIGQEPAFVGTVFGLNAGQTSGVIEGEGAAFVVRPSSFNDAEIPEFTDELRAQIRTQLLNRKRQQIRQQWIQDLRDDAEIEDFRDLRS